MWSQQQVSFKMFALTFRLTDRSVFLCKPCKYTNITTSPLHRCLPSSANNPFLLDMSPCLRIVLRSFDFITCFRHCSSACCLRKQRPLLSFLVAEEVAFQPVNQVTEISFISNNDDVENGNDILSHQPIKGKRSQTLLC